MHSIYCQLKPWDLDGFTPAELLALNKQIKQQMENDAEDRAQQQAPYG